MGDTEEVDPTHDPRKTVSEPVIADVSGSPFSSRSASPDGVSTPKFADIKHSLSFKSLRDLELSKVHTRVWRKPGERRRWPRDLEQLVLYSTRGALRAFITAYGLRASFNLIIVLFRLLRTSRLKSTLFINALLGKDNWRLGSMMATFVFLFKWTFHGLRLYNPGPNGKGKQEKWHAAAAGSVSALAVLCEKPSRRITYAQQMFVRGLQGSYNMLHARNVVRIPNGDVLLFGLSCAQIMYAWLMSPESLPPGYLRWITNASRVPPQVLPINLARQRIIDLPMGELDKLLSRKDITAKNRMLLDRFKADAANGHLGPPFAFCAAVHPWIDSCRVVPFDRFQSVFRWIFPVYAALHFAPPILLRRKAFAKNPVRFLSKSSIGTLRSSTFLAAFVALFQTTVCLQRNIYKGFNLPPFLSRMLLSKYYYFVGGFLTCIPLFIEEKKRRGELAMYVLPKALESIWNIARRRSYVPFVPGGEVLLTAAGLSQVMSAYVHDPMRLSGIVRTLLYQFTGPE